jgi:hypothetical protein
MAPINNNGMALSLVLHAVLMPFMCSCMPELVGINGNALADKLSDYSEKQSKKSEGGASVELGVTGNLMTAAGISQSAGGRWRK